MVATFLVTSSQAAEGGVNLDFDATLFVQVGFILVLWLVLKPVLFDPMLRLYEEREKRIEGAIKKARKIDERSAEAMTEYDETMAKARAEGEAEREKLRAESVRTENELLTKVRGETQVRVDAARAETEKELEATRAALAPHTQTIARDLAKRVLGREVIG
ncbi:MAG TPA: ATP synthase F0 subunit B [Polyangiaceae bacterium]|jgi:F-type H+-transporting ATPase subunit b